VKKTWILLCLLFPSFLSAQEASSSQASAADWTDRTQIPSTSRFEVFRTRGLSALAFKLDKYEGVVYELTVNRGFRKSKDDQFAWQRTTRMAHPQDTGRLSGQVNYQIVASRVGPILLNVQTGAGWMLGRDTVKDEAYWYPIPLQGGIITGGE
jgi:hypothetical protein